MIYYLDLWSSTLRVIAPPLHIKRENTFQTIYIFEKICSGQILYEEIYYDLAWLLTNITAHFYIQATFNGWSTSQMRLWVGEICFEQGFTEKCDLTFYFFYLIKVTAYPLSIQIIWRKLNPDWVRGTQNIFWTWFWYWRDYLQ